MTAPVPPPADPAALLAWLADRESVRALVVSFARCIDTKDGAGYAAHFAEDAVLELPHGRFEGRAAIAAMPGPRPGWTTQHLVGTPAIEVDGDRATVSTPVQATHVLGAGAAPAHSGGWYEQVAVRTPQGWRFASVRLAVSWTSASMLPAGVGATSLSA